MRSGMYASENNPVVLYLERMGYPARVKVAAVNNLEVEFVSELKIYHLFVCYTVFCIVRRYIAQGQGAEHFIRTFQEALKKEYKGLITLRLTSEGQKKHPELCTFALEIRENLSFGEEILSKIITDIESAIDNLSQKVSQGRDLDVFKKWFPLAFEAFRRVERALFESVSEVRSWAGEIKISPTSLRTTDAPAIASIGVVENTNQLIETSKDSSKSGIKPAGVASTMDKEKLVHNDLEIGMGEEFCEVYNAAWSKLVQLHYLDKEGKLAQLCHLDLDNAAVRKTKIGLIMIMLQAAFNMAKPQRLIEYELNSDRLVQSLWLDDEGKDELIKQLNRYKRIATNLTDIGRIPKADELSLQSRNELWKEIVDLEFRSMLEDKILLNWYNPIVEVIASQISTGIRRIGQTDRPYKLGLAGLSKMVVENIYRALIRQYGRSTLRIQMIHGGMSDKEVARVIQEHNRKDATTPVITLVAGAANYGVNLASDVAWRFVGWDGGRGVQLDKRLHTSPWEYCTVFRIVPSGIARYMRELEDGKTQLAAMIQGAQVGNLELFNNKTITAIFGPFLRTNRFKELANYTPEIVRRPLPNRSGRTTKKK